MLSDRCPICLSCLSICLFVSNVGVLWPNGWIDRDETWQGGRPRSRPHCVRWGPTSPSPKGAQPQFSAHICCGQMVGWIKIPRGMEVSLSPGDSVLDGDPASSPKRGGAPQFLAHVYCGQTAAWIKMPLGTEVGLGPGDFVFDRDPARPRRKGHTLPQPILAHVYCSQTAG